MCVRVREFWPVPHSIYGPMLPRPILLPRSTPLRTWRQVHNLTPRSSSGRRAPPPQTHLETYETVSPDAEHWRAVLRTLELSPQQQAELRGVHELFEGIMRGILAERQVRGGPGRGSLHKLSVRSMQGTLVER